MASTTITHTMPPTGTTSPLLSPHLGLLFAVADNVLISLGVIFILTICHFYLSARYSDSMSPDSTISSMFPDRPIHPLPKRRLRERLSPEVADSIEYPPTPPSTVFYYPYNGKEDDSDHKNKTTARTRGTPANGDVSRRLEIEEEDSSARRSQAVPRSVSSILGPSAPLQKANLCRDAGHAPPSTASSVDGYDTFENTNNKKKRKVPDTALGGHSLNDLGPGSNQMSPSTPSHAVHAEGCDASCGAYHGMGSGSPGISGPGRGRFGRLRSGRSPLSEGSRNSKLRPAARWSPLAAPSPGIISNAILKVGKNPTDQGQENVSLLDLQQTQARAQPPKSRPASGQFTFTCDSQVPGTVPWPGNFTKPFNMAPTHPTQSGSPKTAKPSSAAPDHIASPAHPRPGAAPGAQPPPQKPRRRRSKSDELARAAAERKRQTQLYNAQNPQKEEDKFICLFCEYELIFGVPPEALIRQYEIKDRKRRKEEEERRRLLEKAKARARKGKKPMAGKAPSKNGTAAHDRHNQDHGAHGHVHDGVNGHHSHHHDHAVYECGHHAEHDHNCGHGTDHDQHCPGHGDYDHVHDSHQCDGHAHDHHHDHHCSGHDHEHGHDGHPNSPASHDEDGNETVDNKSSESFEGEFEGEDLVGDRKAIPRQAKPPDLGLAARAQQPVTV